MRPPDNDFKISQEFVHLARIALAGRFQDVQAFLQRTARRTKTQAPDLSTAVSDLLKEAPTRSSPLRRQAEVPLPVDLDSRLQLMRVEDRPVLDWEPIFSPCVARQLNAVVEERVNSDALRAAALEPTRTALFIGPPGVGKTMAARWVARELGRPLLTLDLAAVMSSYLGRTGGNLRLVLDYAKDIDCVLLLDELDSIAKRRDDREEIGELKRLVTVLIQQIDDWPSSNLLIAATNHAELLDPAIWRRFESVIEFPLPDRSIVESFMLQALRAHTENAKQWARVMSIALEGQSFSDIARSIAFTRRQAALRGEELDKHLADTLKAGRLGKQSRIDLAVALVEQGILSARKAQELTGVARDTIRTRQRADNAAEGTFM
jgi:ATP-dependent 26S proteasome regulatory subunit